jgi:membrane-bound lytic murein transglycosylase D|tara:strand:- start:14330 stop:15916 length:1587 start_codon:yes stop_codon:yes gene_type:complete
METPDMPVLQKADIQSASTPPAKDPLEAHSTPSSGSSEATSTLPANDDLWQRIRNGFQLNHEIDRKRVKWEIEYYEKHPEYIGRVVNRARRHLFHIVELLEEQDMPLEIALLPVIESAFDPFAYSHGRASGLWQFIPSTARVYGLRIDWWYDGRRDVRDSTMAAVNYLQKLHTLLGDDWFLALAAYNAGQGNIGSSIRRNQRDGKSVDYWSLKVPKETQSYIPRLLAISEIIANPEDHGIKLKEVQNSPYWVEVNIGSQLDLGRAAELADISSKELYLLNPGFNQWSTHPDGPHQLLLPVERAEAFSIALAELPAAQRLAWKRHKIHPGETLGIIAARYKTTVSAVKAANNIKGSMIRAGDSLTIPMASNDASYPMTTKARLKSDQKYYETKYGNKPVQYTVKSGDSFWDLSRRFDVGMRELAKWNGLGTTSILYPGMKLLVFNTSISPTPSPDQSPGFSPGPIQQPRQDVIRKVNYRVRRGESLSLIADKFNLSVNKIKRWNETLNSKKYIQPGDEITLFVDVTVTE